MDPSVQPISVHEDLLSRQIKTIDNESKFAARFMRNSELLGISSDDLVNSIKMLIENNLPKDSYSSSDKYITNLCEQNSLKKDQVSDFLLDKLHQDRRDKSVLEGKYADIHEQNDNRLKIYPERASDSPQKHVQISEKAKLSKKKTTRKKSLQASVDSSRSLSPLSATPRLKMKKES